VTVVGVGLDLIEIARVSSILDRQGEAFLDRVLHRDDPRDRAGRRDGAAHVAGLFAAKEAVMKALGTGMSGASFREIRVRHTDRGQPFVELEGATLERARALGVEAWRVSITHSRTAAAAVALALGTPRA